MNKQQREEAVALYLAGESLSQVASRFGVTLQAIAYNLEVRGIPRRPLRRNELNQDCFAEITEESAYWAGFLMADGCVADSAKGVPIRGGPLIRLKLAVRDEEHVAAFRKFAGSTAKIQTDGESSWVAFGSRKIASDLARFGVLPRKTHTAEVRLLEGNRHFWRGVVDGDGCLSCMPSGHPRFQVMGSRPLMEQFVDEVVLRIRPSSQTRLKPKKRMFQFSTSHNFAHEITDYLYRDATIYLPRKFAIYESWGCCHCPISAARLRSASSS